MSTAPADHGTRSKTYLGFQGPGTGTGSFQPAANTSVNTVTDTNVPANASIIFSAANAAGGLLARSSSLFVSTGNNAGSFTFNSSATAAVAPTGSETFAYFFTQD